MQTSKEFWCEDAEARLGGIEVLALTDNPGNPKGSKDPNNRALGPETCNINGIWDLQPYYLGAWTLREKPWISYGIDSVEQSGRKWIYRFHFSNPQILLWGH